MDWQSSHGESQYCLARDPCLANSGCYDGTYPRLDLGQREQNLDTIPMKYLFSILTIFTVCSVAYAGTGPDTNSWSEGFYFTKGTTGSTSTIINLYFPTLSAAPDYAEYLDHNPGHKIYVNRVIGQPTSTCWSYTGGLSGSYSASTYYATNTIIVNATSGDLYIGFSPYESTAPELNTGDAPYGTSVMELLDVGLRYCLNWTSPYYDIDMMSLSGGTTSTLQEVDWNDPDDDTVPGVVAAPSNFDVDAFNYVEAGHDYRFKFTIYDESIGSIKVYEWYAPWVDVTSTDPNWGQIYDVPIDLYRFGYEIPYKIIATLQERVTGESDITDLGSDTLYRTVGSEMTTSTRSVLLTPFPTSTASSTTGRSDCGDWYQFNFSCHLENFARYLFQPRWVTPNAGVTSPFATLMEETMVTFPFSLFGAQREFYVSGLDDAKDDSVSDLSFTFNIGGQTSSIPVAGETFLEDYFGSDVANLYFNMILVLFTLAFFGHAFSMGYKLLDMK